MQMKQTTHNQSVNHLGTGTVIVSLRYEVGEPPLASVIVGGIQLHHEAFVERPLPLLEDRVIESLSRLADLLKAFFGDLYGVDERRF